MDIIFNNNEVSDSVKKTVKKRLTTPIYGVFFISWAIFHWQLLYTALFVDEKLIFETTGLLKNKYLVATFFDYGTYWFYLLWILPVFTTYLIIWHLPDWISIPAFKKEEQDRIKKRKIQLEAEKDLEQAQVEKLSVSEERVKKEKEVARTEKEIETIDPSKNWYADYKRFRELPIFKSFNFITQAIYEYQGSTRKNTGYGWFTVPKDILAYAHSHGLITFDSTKEKIDLTDKGKYFVRKFSNEK